MTASIAVACHAAVPVEDQATFDRVVNLVFPGATISRVEAAAAVPVYEVKDPAGRVIAHQSDALAAAPAYNVVGTPESFERDFADHIDAQAQPLADHRHVRMRLYRWQPREQAPMLVAVLAYNFRGSKPARCCLDLGRVILLNISADRILDDFRISPHAFGPFTEIRFLCLADGPELLMLGAGYAPAATSAVVSVVLDVRQDRWRPILAIDTLIQYFAGNESEDDVHTLTLDEARTKAAVGKRFYFVRQTWMRKGRTLSRPSTERMSYPAGFGLPLSW